MQQLTRSYSFVSGALCQGVWVSYVYTIYETRIKNRHINNYFSFFEYEIWMVYGNSLIEFWVLRFYCAFPFIYRVYKWNCNRKKHTFYAKMYSRKVPSSFVENNLSRFNFWKMKTTFFSFLICGENQLTSLGKCFLSFIGCSKIFTLVQKHYWFRTNKKVSKSHFL